MGTILKLIMGLKNQEKIIGLFEYIRIFVYTKLDSPIINFDTAGEL